MGISRGTGFCIKILSCIPPRSFLRHPYHPYAPPQKAKQNRMKKQNEKRGIFSIAVNYLLSFNDRNYLLNLQMLN